MKDKYFSLRQTFTLVIQSFTDYFLKINIFLTCNLKFLIMKIFMYANREYVCVIIVNKHSMK